MKIDDIEAKIKLDAEEGKTILETLQEHGIHVLTAPCGGRGRCGKCTVEVEHMGEVLACMTKVTDGMRITIPKVQLRAQKSKIAENAIKTTPFDIFLWILTWFSIIFVIFVT